MLKSSLFLGGCRLCVDRRRGDGADHNLANHNQHHGAGARHGSACDGDAPAQRYAEHDRNKTRGGRLRGSGRFQEDDLWQRRYRGQRHRNKDDDRTAAPDRVILQLYDNDLNRQLAAAAACCSNESPARRQAAGLFLVQNISFRIYNIPKCNGGLQSLDGLTI